MTRIGLMPLYIELYDSAMPEVRPRIDEFLATIAGELRGRGLEVVETPVCRVKHEFEGAIRRFEASGAHAIVTLHLAYSPSLESAEALARTPLPLIVLDTTPSPVFGPDSDPDELMYNHGIHGVQDMCNLLVRNGKTFCIEAGHWAESDVLERVCGDARAAMAAASMRRARVGRIGEAFAGMGDFAVESPVLHRIGMEVVECSPSDLGDLVPSPDDPEVASEIAADSERFDISTINPDLHLKSVQAGLAVRKWVARERLSAFSMNFLAFTKRSGIPTVPFLEASKSMSRGTGYAGEGDVLTAGLVGALASAYPQTTFTEMFCPDWSGNRIYLSHMGEINVDVSAEKCVLRESEFPWTDIDNPVIAVGRLRSGDAVLVDLAPGPQDELRLIVAPVRVVDVTGHDNMRAAVHGWLQPRMPIADFLADYSRAGGTHHCALIYGEVAGEAACFGEMMGWRVLHLG